MYRYSVLGFNFFFLSILSTKAFAQWDEMGRCMELLYDAVLVNSAAPNEIYALHQNSPQIESGEVPAINLLTETWLGRSCLRASINEWRVYKKSDIKPDTPIRVEHFINIDAMFPCKSTPSQPCGRAKIMGHSIFRRIVTIKGWKYGAPRPVTTIGYDKDKRVATFIIEDKNYTAPLSKIIESNGELMKANRTKSLQQPNLIRGLK